MVTLVYPSWAWRWLRPSTYIARTMLTGTRVACAPCAANTSPSTRWTPIFLIHLPTARAQESPCDANDYIDEWREFVTKYPVEDYQAWLGLLKNDNAQPQIFVREADSITSRKMSWSAYTAKYKVHIIWLPEKLRDDAANKLLKLIEEPYDDCKFILVSDNAKVSWAPSYSRSQRIELRSASAPIVAQFLAGRYGMEMQDALALAAPADGNVVMADRRCRPAARCTSFTSALSS